MSLLVVQDLAVTLPLSLGLQGAFRPKTQRRLEIFSDISFAVASGETLGLVGESGSGKTTLARALLGLTPIQAGRITFDGRLRAAQALCRSDAPPLRALSPDRFVRCHFADPVRN